ncbi:hypothetical protein DQX05_00495 [Paenibacillus thiaminolyticus]|uniref:Uncharacterized protein n=1 Tax=Paenibacillus thiaminolyticus TaxID=49283 RepID=A0A3A3GS66_PANTH|nr:hypothetical protein DQX05_00495 [Paenibacillus thiaminolyticus]
MIQHIYAGNINRILGPGCRGNRGTIFLIIVLFIINRIIVLVIAKGYTSKDILTLLKTNKEFE